jgi:hypothetical protein
MKENRDSELNKVTLKSLETKLRSIPQPDAPVTLKLKLLKVIPKKPRKEEYARTIRPRLGILGYGATAAMVFILTLIVILNFGRSTAPRMFVPGPNDGIYNYPNDLNVPSVKDINYVNYNVQWQSINNAGTISPQ